MKEPVTTVANRYARSIKEEIRLLPERMKKHLDTFSFGFIFHNLASPCEMLNEYFGAELRDLKFNYLMDKIEEIGRKARYFQAITESGQATAEEKDELLIFGMELESLVPSLFFMV